MVEQGYTQRKMFYFMPGRHPFWVWWCEKCEEPIGTMEEVAVRPLPDRRTWHMECLADGQEDKNAG